ncbi:type I-E CRISPR-associated protein Cas5/CasD [Butyricicoccus sp.]|uniref:type I-E CRISPR-associated protein Cas5/CasD n=1 Tax=Butyricicoccus sp. TaxID=2049021 RepID=UPI003D7C8F82
MAENKKLLVLCLEGMLQSWGTDAKWDIRDTGDMPTKSGIVGLLACAMGLERGNPEIAAMSDAMTLAVREDRAGTRLVDFHTVTGNPLMNAAGKRRSLGDTFISQRQYLQDASFLVFIDCADDWRERMIYALQHPKWCLYLGRKSCVPSRPVLVGVTEEYTDIAQALQTYPIQTKRRDPRGNTKQNCRYESEISNTGDSTLSRSDVVLADGYRRFARRRVWRGTVKEVPYVSE